MKIRIKDFAKLTCFLTPFICIAGTANADLIWYEYDGHEYALTSTWSNWQASELEAVSVGGHLVTIDDAAENLWLTTTFSNTFNRSGGGQAVHAIAWIGYYYDDSLSEWKWISGSPVTYSNHYYPKWPEGGEFAYLHVSPHASAGTWNANSFHDSDYYYQPMGIIERSLIPEPTALFFLAPGIVALASLAMRRRHSS